MEPTVSTYQASPEPQKKKNPLVLIAVVIVLLLAGFFIYRQSKKTSPTQIKVVETPTTTPTEQPKIDKSTVKIQVLNGTGTPGQAGKAVDALTKAGYSASNIKTGNATEYKHTTATVSSKTGFENIVSDIKTALSSLFDTINVDSSLAADSAYDVVITTGGKIFETPTPVATASPSITPTSGPTGTPTPTPTLTP